MLNSRLLFSVGMLAAIVGCGDMHSITGSSTNSGSGGPPPPAASFSSIHANILQPMCVGCHSWYSTYNGTMTRVTPGNPSASPLYARCADGTMPQGGPPLTAGELQAINDWITAGAPNN